jgi:hypothetical protein
MSTDRQRRRLNVNPPRRRPHPRREPKPVTGRSTTGSQADASTRRSTSSGRGRRSLLTPGVPRWGRRLARPVRRSPPAKQYPDTARRTHDRPPDLLRAPTTIAGHSRRRVWRPGAPGGISHAVLRVSESLRLTIVYEPGEEGMGHRVDPEVPGAHKPRPDPRGGARERDRRSVGHPRAALRPARDHGTRPGQRVARTRHRRVKRRDLERHLRIHGANSCASAATTATGSRRGASDRHPAPSRNRLSARAQDLQGPRHSPADRRAIAGLHRACPTPPTPRLRALGSAL